MLISSLLCNGQSGVGIPEPRIEIARLSNIDKQLNPNHVNYFIVPTDSPPNTNKLGTATMLLFIAEQIPQELFSYDLRLEVLHYTKTAGSRDRIGRRGFHKPTHGTSSTQSSPAAWPITEYSYAHPSGNYTHMAARNPASRYNGGVDPYWGFVSEYSVTSHGQRFYLDGMGSFFMFTSVKYWNDGAEYSAEFPVPRGRLGASKTPGKLNGVSRMFGSGYFKFRLSIASPENSRERIYGPTTETMTIGPVRWPFMRMFELSAREGRTSVEAFPKGLRYSCWWSERVPGTK